MVNTLPEKKGDDFSENCYPVYVLETETSKTEEPVATQVPQRSKSISLSEETQAVQSIRLRNLLLDLVEQLLVAAEPSIDELVVQS